MATTAPVCGAPAPYTPLQPEAAMAIPPPPPSSGPSANPSVRLRAAGRGGVVTVCAGGAWLCSSCRGRLHASLAPRHYAGPGGWSQGLGALMPLCGATLCCCSSRARVGGWRRTSRRSWPWCAPRCTGNCRGRMPCWPRQAHCWALLGEGLGPLLAQQGAQLNST